MSTWLNLNASGGHEGTRSPGLTKRALLGTSFLTREEKEALPTRGLPKVTSSTFQPSMARRSAQMVAIAPAGQKAERTADISAVASRAGVWARASAGREAVCARQQRFGGRLLQPCIAPPRECPVTRIVTSVGGCFEGLAMLSITAWPT